jgi:hypothetical protein
MLDVTCAPSQRHGPLTVFPLISRIVPELPYALMADALAAGTLTIEEVGSGTVPELTAVNTSGKAVLILDGEQLVGARQNRTTNRSIILPAKGETRIPVSCMEQGRWHDAGESFKPAPYNSPSSVRRHARDTEVRHAKSAGKASHKVLAEAQGAVWSSIALNAASLGTRSDTGALNELYTARSLDIEDWAGSFPKQERQIGLLAYLGTHPLGLDVIGCTRLYARSHERIVRGYIIDALASRVRQREVTGDHAQAYLGWVNTAGRTPSPTAGAGNYSVLSGRVVGGELEVGGTLVHLVAFPAAKRPIHPEEPVQRDPLAPPSRRRRRFE